MTASHWRAEAAQKMALLWPESSTIKRDNVVLCGRNFCESAAGKRRAASAKSCHSAPRSRVAKAPVVGVGIKTNHL